MLRDAGFGWSEMAMLGVGGALVLAGGAALMRQMVRRLR